MGRSAVTARTSAQWVGVLAAGALAFTALAFGLGAPAASAVPRGSLVRTTSLSVAQGGTVTISGNVTPSGNCAPGSIVQLTSTPDSGTTNLFPGGLGPKVASNASGAFQTSIVIPLSTPVGSYTVGVLCGPVTVPTNEILNVTAATHPPSITVTPTSIAQGGAVTIAGVVPTTGASFCPEADTAQLTSTSALFPSAGFGPDLTRNATGNFTTSYTVPSTTAVGTYSIGIRCGGGNVGVTATLAVTAATATTTTAPTTTTTTTVSPATTVAPALTLPATTTTLAPPAKTNSKSKNRTLRWVALAVFVVVVVAAVVVIVAKRDRPTGI